MRAGLIAEKLGMTQVFTDTGVQVPVTVLKVERCTVLEQKTEVVDGYSAVKVGAKPVAANKLSKPLRGYYAKKESEPFKISKEFRVTEEAILDIGTVLASNHFSEGQLVDVTGISKGKGFAGPMKRYGFGGLRATHGVSLSHRSHGSTGNRTEPGRVFKNKRMAGHMGHTRVTKLNLTLHAIDSERDLLFVRGSVPGPKGSLVFVRDAIKA
ncbi:50S ribosomal protein L3 [Alphaproteobacteria bacterium]|nr:50S ribosomal protein L3 [Alphaproteobacteria bacterium]GHS96652.1 50S ribosomal protein L3 [Alphaproteobacteria bacterium]